MTSGKYDEWEESMMRREERYWECVRTADLDMSASQRQPLYLLLVTMWVKSSRLQRCQRFLVIASCSLVWYHLLVKLGFKQ